jgi:hypothetical protein
MKEDGCAGGKRAGKGPADSDKLELLGLKLNKNKEIATGAV